jgi:hypothetical protein
MPEGFTAIFYHSSLNDPITINVSSEEKFTELCEILPTDWAHLMNFRTGEIVSSWSSEDVSWKNN